MKPYHKNPRQIKRKRLDRLTDTLARLGDLGGIVHNIRTDEVIGGNQRTRVFGEASQVEIVEQRDTPDAQGTVAHGFVVWRGNKFAYRRVDWDEATAEEANIAANLGAGDWDWDILANQWDSAMLINAGMDADLLKELNVGAAAVAEMLRAADGGAHSGFLSDMTGDDGDADHEGHEFNNPYVGLQFPADVEQRNYVMRVIGQAKKHFDVATSTDALLKICEFWTSNADI